MWTDIELEILKRYYARADKDTFVIFLPERTYEEIQVKAKELRLRRNKIAKLKLSTKHIRRKKHKYTTEDDILIRAYFPDKDTLAMKLPDKPWPSIYTRANYLMRIGFIHVKRIKKPG